MSQPQQERGMDESVQAEIQELLTKDQKQITERPRYESYTFVYTLSDKGDMVKDCIRSLKSLSKFIPKENIIVFLTPPRSEESSNKLSIYANVIEAENITEPFIFQENRGYGRYGEKIHVCDIETENVFFLDCDTIIKKNPLELLEWNCDFAARSESMHDFDLGTWYNMFIDRGLEPISVFNAGFFLFKNYSHKKIKSDWLKYQNEDLPMCHLFSYQKDQYSLALSVNNLNIKLMGRNEHAFRWMDEEHIDSIILHGTKPRLKYLRKFLRNTFLGDLKNLIRRIAS